MGSVSWCRHWHLNRSALRRVHASKAGPPEKYCPSREADARAIAPRVNSGLTNGVSEGVQEGYASRTQHDGYHGLTSKVCENVRAHGGSKIETVATGQHPQSVFKRGRSPCGSPHSKQPTPRGVRQHKQHTVGRPILRSSDRPRQRQHKSTFHTTKRAASLRPATREVKRLHCTLVVSVVISCQRSAVASCSSAPFITTFSTADAKATEPPPLDDSWGSLQRPVANNS